MDDPRDEDLAAGARLRNTVWEVHAVWRPYPLLVGLEYRRIATEYGAPLAGSLRVGHVNLAMGFEF